MIADIIARQGNWLFRWRSYVLLGFAPLFIVAVLQPEPIEHAFGEAADFLFEGLCTAIAFLGLGIRIFTVGYVPRGTSGRNTKGQIASTLNTTGMYSLTRNPLYLGNAIIYMAIAMFTQSLTVVIAMGLFLVIYLERIIATEERFLSERFGETYLGWAREVPAFFPRFTGWVAPALPFSLVSVIRREYSGLFAIIVVLSLIELGRDIFEGKSQFDAAWMIALVAGTAAYLAIIALKKGTRLLDVRGR
jgi:protein-S-isoprenylcysteine O-methyltransferase Ste14